MLLKYTQAQKRIKSTGVGKPQRTAGKSSNILWQTRPIIPNLFASKCFNCGALIIIHKSAIFIELEGLAY